MYGLPYAQFYAGSNDSICRSQAVQMKQSIDYSANR